MERDVTVTATIVDLDETDDACVECAGFLWRLTLRIEGSPPPGRSIGDIVQATSCIDRACTAAAVGPAVRRLDG